MQEKLRKPKHTNRHQRASRVTKKYDSDGSDSNSNTSDNSSQDSSKAKSMNTVSMKDYNLVRNTFRPKIVPS